MQFISRTLGKMESQVDKVVKVYKTVAHYPSVTSARVLKSLVGGNGVTVLSSWSQRNLERGKSVKFQQMYIVDPSLQDHTELLPVDITFELLSSISSSEELRAVLREVPQDETKKKQYLEIWRQRHLWKNYDLQALEVHGDVYADADFGSFEWSPCGEKILYIAEKKLPKTEPFYKQKPSDTKGNASGDAKPLRGEEYLYRPDWGEQLVGKHQPVVSVCDIKTDGIRILDGIPSHFSPGQVVWTPDGEGVIGVVWKNEPRRLGLIYCTNRDSYIFHLTMDGVFSLLSEDGQAVRSPRFSADGRNLIWLQRPAGGPHHAAHKLVCFNWETKKKEVLIDIVRRSVKTTGGSPFYGLYNLALPRRCWSSDSKRILLSTPQRHKVNSYVVDVETKTITELEWDDGSQSILDVWNDIVVCSRSSLKSPANIVLGKLPPTGSEGTMQWLPVTSWEMTPALDALVCHTMTLTQENDTEATVKTYCAIYFGPESTKEKDIPLIVWPHGGPHSAFANAFILDAALLTLLGFGVLMVNYRGSVGAGQDSVDSLPGRIGDADVKDVHYAATEALKQFPFLNPEKVFLFGGSHGGFLVTHLSGQYPKDFKAVVARNPVTDVAAMFSVTDIPDWTAVEAGYQYNVLQDMSIEAFEKMKKCSPINHMNNVVSPTLFMVGKKDARVPSSQAIGYYHLLHSNNVKTKLLLYEDNHPLSQVPVEMDNLINSVLWFMQHME